MRLVVGLGASSGVPEEAVAELLARVVDRPEDVVAFASIDRRADEPGLLAAIAPAPLRTYPAAALDGAGAPGGSARVRAATGTGSVAEAAALLAATELAGPGEQVRLRVAKTVGDRCTAAVAEIARTALSRN
ncbi:cobalamin biosynthesis protein [Pseudonocardia sp.]|uniref:cobalamin biosynthesis protein n=1 Tax=Pseudonocardia sp. TaxID=60912 RepID=UPI003D0EF5D6